MGARRVQGAHYAQQLPAPARGPPVLLQRPKESGACVWLVPLYPETFFARWFVVWRELHPAAHPPTTPETPNGYCRRETEPCARFALNCLLVPLFHSSLARRCCRLRRQILAAIAAGKTRIKVKMEFPELNVEARTTNVPSAAWQAIPAARRHRACLHVSTARFF